MNIGTFMQDNNGIMHGKIYGLGLGVTSVLLDPQTSREGKTYFRLIADPVGEAYEIGAAFPKMKDGKPYHSVTVESPALPAPVHAALFPNNDEEGTFNLIWNRPETQAPKAEIKSGLNGQSRHNRRYAGAHPVL